MSSLGRFEARLQRLIEESTSRLFAAKDTKSLLAANLIEAMQHEVQFGEGDKLLAPGIYTIHASEEHAQELRGNQALLDELKQTLLAAAEASGVQLSCPPVLHIAAESELSAGQFRVRSAGLGESLSQTQALRPLAVASANQQLPADAFLIVGGIEIFQLTQPIVNIGRKKDNHLVIDNPSVSRRHAQLRAISGQYHFFDLGSTGGSRVNNQDVKTAILTAGDVISLAGVPLIYGQDAGPFAETQEFRPQAGQP